MANEFKAKNGVITPILQSTVATGTAPLIVASETLVNNLYVARAAQADTVTGPVQGTITSVGTLTDLTVSGTITSTKASGAPFVVASTSLVNNLYVARAAVADTVTGSQGNITGVGTLTQLTLSGQLTSTVPTGTAPFVIASTTRVANLNVATAGTADSATTALTVTGATQSAITSVGTLTGLVVSGQLESTITGLAPFVVASNVQVTNLKSEFAGQADSATTATTVTGAAQTNITSLGTLTGLTTSGQITSTIATGTAPLVVTSTTRVANLNVARAGLADSATSATSATTAGTVTTAAQPTITSVGTLTGLTVSGQITSTLATGTAPLVVTSTTRVANLNVATAGQADSATTAGTVTTAAQPAITSLGTLTGLTVSGQITSNTDISVAPFVVSSTARVANLNVARAGTADQLTTIRNISATGDLSYTIAFDGSASVTGTATLANTGVTAGSYINPTVTVDAKGRITSATNGANSEIVTDVFTGTGSQTAFTLSATPTTISYTTVTIDGITQSRGNAYTLANNIITFTEAPQLNAVIEVSIVKAIFIVSPGVAALGTTGQILVKNSNTSYDTTWTSSLSLQSLSLSGQLTSTATTGTAPLVIASTTRVANLNVATAGQADNATTAGTVTAAAQSAITSVGTLTGLTTSGQLTSTLATGTAPLVIASTTRVANLNVAQAGTADSADTSVKLTTARTIGMTGDVTYTSASFDGTANVTGTATLANSGVTAGTYTKVTVDAKGRVTVGALLASSDVTTALGYTPLSNATSYLPLAGGTMTGAISFAGAQTWPTFNQNTTGSAATLTTARTIGMTGDVTWTSASFNGSANVTGTATLSNAAVIGQVLTGFSATPGPVAATDTILGALQEIYGNLNVSTTLTLTSNATTIDASAGSGRKYRLTTTTTSAITITISNLPTGSGEWEAELMLTTTGVPTSITWGTVTVVYMPGLALTNYPLATGKMTRIALMKQTTGRVTAMVYPAETIA